MREIKFRVWYVPQNRWLDGIDWENYQINTLMPSRKLGSKIETITFEGSFNAQINNNFIIQQYTGIKDSAGREIYEGDIVKWDDSYCHINPGVIVWSQYEEMGWFIAVLGQEDDPECIKKQLYQEVNGVMVAEEYQLTHFMDGSKRTWKDPKQRYGIYVLGNVYENKELLTVASSYTKNHGVSSRELGKPLE